MGTEEQLDRLTGIVSTLPDALVANNNRVEQLTAVVQKHQKEWEELRRSGADAIRLFEAYLKRLPPQ